VSMSRDGGDSGSMWMRTVLFVAWGGVGEAGIEMPSIVRKFSGTQLGLY